MNAVANKLFSPFAIKHFTLKNRIGVAPMTRISSAKDAIPRQDVLDFLVRRARNGAGMVCTEAIVTDYESAQGYPRQSRITTQKQIDAWQAVTEAIRETGAMSVLQMFHCGRMAYEGINPANRSIAPSAIAPRQDNPLTGRPYPVPEAMSRFDIDHVVNGFVETARGAVAAGFDAIEIHGAHGYLISQFMSGYSNIRTDGYGGSTEARYRFAHEVIEAVRRVVPEDRLLFFRISNWGVADMQVSLFADRQEWQQVIRLLSAEPLDALSISTYDFQEKAFGIDQTMIQLTRQVTDKPLFICGRIHDRATAEKGLEDADVVLFAKSMLLNPDLVEDLRQDRKLPCYRSEEANVAYTDTPLP
jgi:2,4-dienoyl-CoA reductase-like NADH-dependent reductase (Old Yellow Enzyme family)